MHTNINLPHTTRLLHKKKHKAPGTHIYVKLFNYIHMSFPVSFTIDIVVVSFALLVISSMPFLYYIEYVPFVQLLNWLLLF